MESTTSANALDPERTITVVSGLPRSGTSLMMQMLEAAGLEVARDATRAADEDNPKGYYELAAVRRLSQDASFLEATTGCVVKVVVPLLRHLPGTYDYRLVFMERALDEVLASQRVMLRRRAASEGAADDEMLARAFERELRETKAWLAGRPRMPTCFVAHADLIASPLRTSRRIADFLAANGGLAAEAGATDERERVSKRMSEVVDPELYRQRGRRPA